MHSSLWIPSQRVMLLAALTITVLYAPGGASGLGFADQSGTVSLDYRIGPRDLLEVRVFDLAELDSSVRVSEAGTITLPLIGDVTAAGLTRSELESAIGEALKRYVNNPQVTIFIREYESQRFSVIGAVRTPGTYEMVGGMTLLEAISEAGGVNNADADGSVMILRPASEDPILIELDDLLERGNANFNVSIEPGDTINVIPKRQYNIFIYGRVRTPGSYPLREEISLLQAISLAGGFADRAARGKTRILRRRPDGTQELIQVNVAEIVDGKRPDFQIRPNDVIIVPETFF